MGYRRHGFWLLILLGTVFVWVWNLPAASSTTPHQPYVEGVCPPISGTPKFTFAYGTLGIAGTPAPVGTVVEARSPRGDTVGCFIVHTEGHYGAMYVYGEDASVQPVIPGMRDGETVAFYVNGTLATASPLLVWHDDRLTHEVNLSVAAVLPTPTPTSTHTYTPTPTNTPTPTPVPTPTPTRTPAALRTIPLAAGWNLVGLPLSPLSERLEDVLAGVPWSAAYAWDCTNQGWLTAFPDVPGPQTFLNVDAKMGFWVRVDRAATLTVGGDPLDVVQIQLCPGWNLISFPAPTARPLPSALASIAGSYKLVYEYDPFSAPDAWRRYDPSAPAYANTLSELSPGRGYWIQATVSVILTIE